MKLFGISKSTCYYLLKELVEKGLIKKTGYKPAIYSITLSKNFIENLGKEKVGVHNIKVVCYLHEVNLHKVVFFLYYLIKIKGKDREEETETNKKKVIYNRIRIESMSEEREIIPVSLPKGLVEEIDELVKRRIFSSRSEALRYGARLVVLFEKGIHKLAEDYAYEMIKERLERREKGVSRH